MNIQLLTYADAQDRARRSATTRNLPVARPRRNRGRVWPRVRAMRHPVVAAPGSLHTSVAWI